MNKKQTIVSTELFKGKPLPTFITDHKLFKTPHKIQKVFPTIGLPNFQAKVNIDKCLTDVKKEGSYVHNLLRVMSDTLMNVADIVRLKADKMQFLEMDKTTRASLRSSMVELYALASTLTTVANSTDPLSKDVLENAIQTADGKITLTMLKDVPEPNNPSKPLFRKGEALFRIYGKLRDKCAIFAIDLAALDGLDVFKTFCKENIPNKEYSVVFSSDGPEGAWDILTMSMRSEWHSCQRWEGEYPRCLIGSVLSKFVGVLYLTSGVMSSANDKNGNRNNLGTKMMRRCVVRYAIDADDNKPCIMIDKMYPDFDRTIMDAFMSTLKEKTTLPIYYSPDLGNKIRHIYLPIEKISSDILDREKSYQDTPLKSKNDLNVYILNSNKEEVEREVRGFKVNLAIFMARKLEEVYTDYSHANDEIKKSVNNIRMNTSFTPFCDLLTTSIVQAFRAPQSSSFNNSKTYYKRYLMEFLLKRNQTFTSCYASLAQTFAQHTSRTLDVSLFMSHITSITNQFVKSEIRRISN